MMQVKYIPILVGLLLLIPTLDARATLAEDSFCKDNPGHFACDGKIGTERDDNDDDDPYDSNNNGRDCENPPNAASCNDDQDARGVSTEGFADDGTDINKWENSCYNGGVRDGKDGPFEKEAYQECGDYGDGQDRYYEGFIDGCEDAGNTKEVCESATDA